MSAAARPVYPCDTTPATGAGVELVPGLYWLRLPLPFELNHINVWLLAEAHGWSLVDTGLDGEPGRTAWRQLRRDLMHDRPLERIVVTHLHPDHIGLASHLAGEFDAEVAMTAATRDHARRLWEGPGTEGEAEVRAFCRRHGIERVDDYTAFVTGAGYRRMISGVPDDVTLLDESDRPVLGGQEWTPVIGHGHAPGHMALYCESLGMLISGDQILPGITCNISVFAGNRDEDALAAYLDSLQQFADLPADTTVLPSHGKVFRGLHERIDFIRAHHRENLDRILSLCRQPHSVGQLAPRLFRRSLAGGDYTLAMGETLAHLAYLKNRGELECVTEGGVDYFVKRVG